MNIFRTWSKPDEFKATMKETAYFVARDLLCLVVAILIFVWAANRMISMGIMEEAQINAIQQGAGYMIGAIVLANILVSVVEALLQERDSK